MRRNSRTEQREVRKVSSHKMEWILQSQNPTANGRFFDKKINQNFKWGSHSPLIDGYRFNTKERIKIMKLWTKEIEQKAKTKEYSIEAQDGKGLDAKILVKYFNPYGAGTWLIVNAVKQEDDDWLLFGYCHIFEWEWGYVLLSELQNTKVKLFGYSFPLERDLYVKEGATVKDLI